MNFDKMYRNILKKEIVEEGRYEIRASGMPFCPRKFIISCNEDFNFNYAFDFYVSIGTEIHSRIQTWIPRANDNILFGHWVCYKCGRPIQNPNGSWRIEPYKIHSKVGPVKCPRCGKEMLYDEFTMNFMDAPMSGHCDGVLIDEDSIKGDNILDSDAYVLELKSTSRWNCTNIVQPKHEHDLQATIYVSALRKIFKERYKLNLNLKGYVIKYVSRDNPQITSSDFVKEIKDDKLYNITCKLVNQLYKAVRTNNPKLIYKKIKPCLKWHNVYNFDCPYEDYCEDMNFKEFKELWDAKYDIIRPNLLMKDSRIFIKN